MSAVLTTEAYPDELPEGEESHEKEERQEKTGLLTEKPYRPLIHFCYHGSNAHYAGKRKT